MKVIDSARVTKNSAKLTDPMALLGSTLSVTRVVVAIGPHLPHLKRQLVRQHILTAQAFLRMEALL